MNPYSNNPPSLSVMARGLPKTTTESILKSIVYKNSGIIPVYTKIVKDFNTKQSKGYGYIDFETIEIAKSFMELTGGSIFIENSKVGLFYSNTGRDNEGKDWICDAVLMRCYNCSNSKTEKCVELDEKISRGAGASKQRAPTIELLVRGLSPITKEQTVHRIFDVICPVEKCRIIRDHATLQSKCYGFVEFKTINDATKALKAVDNEGVVIDGMTVRAEYAKRKHLIGREMKTYYPSSYIHHEYSKPKKEELDENNIAVKAAKIRQKAEAEGFQYDLNSGYYFNKQTMLYFDPKTGFYYDVEKGGDWLKLEENGEYTHVTEEILKNENEKKKDYTNNVFGAVDTSLQNTSWGGFGNVDNNQSKSNNNQSNAFGFGFGDIGSLENVNFPSGTNNRNNNNNNNNNNKSDSFLNKKNIIETQTIGHQFVPNPKFKEILEKVEYHESEKELHKLQKKVKKIKKNKKRKRSEAFPEQTKRENVGQKLMKKMGWKEGQALGVNEDGLKNPLSINVRDGRKGLGFANMNQIKVGDSKKIKMNKKTRNRFDQINNSNQYF